MDQEDMTIYRPGQLICKWTEEYQLGEGVYLEGGGIYSGIFGRVEVGKGEDGKKKIGVKGKDKRARAIAVQIGDTVLARVIKLREETVFVSIVSVNGLPTPSSLEGVIKRRDIREKEIDKIILDKCFIPGDIVQAKVCSYGDSRKVQLSTVADDMGVLYAICEDSGNYMVPLSEEEMMCPLTKKTEKRKAALITA